MVCIHVYARVCMCRGQKQIVTIFLYCSLPYPLGKGLFSELETVWLMSSLRYTVCTLKFCGSGCANHTWLCWGLSARDFILTQQVLSPTEPSAQPLLKAHFMNKNYKYLWQMTCCLIEVWQDQANSVFWCMELWRCIYQTFSLSTTLYSWLLHLTKMVSSCMLYSLTQCMCNYIASSCCYGERSPVIHTHSSPVDGHSGCRTPALPVYTARTNCTKWFHKLVTEIHTPTSRR